MNGKIYANIFQQDDIIVINLDGKVEKRFNFGELIADEKDYISKEGITWSYYDRSNNVLNGIAYHEPTDTFFVTGKNWHFIYQVKVYV